MKYISICDYCGDNKTVLLKKPENPFLACMSKDVPDRCTRCNSKLRLKEYDLIDTYVGCTPFVKTEVDGIVETLEKLGYGHDYGSMGPIMDWNDYSFF